MQTWSWMLVHPPRIRDHIRTTHPGFSAPSTSLGATSQEGGGESEGNLEPNDTSNSEQNNGGHEHQLNKEWVKESKYKKQKAKLKRQRINVVFNYSSVKLTEDMENVLNRGLNFAILPLKLDLTQVLTDFKRFERTMIWNEFWYGRENQMGRKKPIFKNKKNNLPRNYKSPNNLKIFLTSIKSELLDPKNRKKAKSNLPEKEMRAILELIQLQKSKQIMIKVCDKGAGIIILDFKTYMKACYDHLESQTLDGENYYVPVTESALEIAKDKLNRLLQEGFENEFISREEYDNMLSSDMNPGKFYSTFKVHKQHTEGEAPPVRPIVSGCGSMFENAGIFVEHHIKEHATKHKSFLQDTPDFLRHVKQLNEESTLTDHALLVTIDAIGCYMNIPQREGAKCVEKVLSERTNQEVPSGFITRLLELILKYNIFQLDDNLYQQRIGTAMGSKPAPSYANIHMANKIDPKFWEIAAKYTVNDVIPIKLLKRFLDDIFMVFTGSVTSLHMFFDEVNQIHPKIKFTMTHTTPKNESPHQQCSCEPIYSIPFLDTLCTIKNGKIETDLYRKPTDKNQYLLTPSCHPIEIFSNVPHSLAMRINRICSEPITREARFKELREMLLVRKYTVGIIDSAISKARSIPREQALKYKSRTKLNTRPVFVVPWDPRLPSIPDLTRRHWRSMTRQDPYLKDVFSEPPLVAYKRQRNIRDKIIRAKIPPNQTRQNRVIFGMKKCGNCPACPYVKEGTQVKTKNKSWNLTNSFNCNTKNIIYFVECQKDRCKNGDTCIYIGETEKPIETRIRQHMGYIRNKILSQATGFHFNSPGHSSSDMKFTVLEQVRSRDLVYRKEREKYLIKEFNSYYRGLNRSPE